MDAPPPSQWDASNAVRLWWGDKTCRQPQVQDTCAPPRSSEQAVEDQTSNDDSFTLSLADWEDWII